MSCAFGPPRGYDNSSYHPVDMPVLLIIVILVVILASPHCWTGKVYRRTGITVPNIATTYGCWRWPWFCGLKSRHCMSLDFPSGHHNIALSFRDVVTAILMTSGFNKCLYQVFELLISKNANNNCDDDDELPIYRWSVSNYTLWVKKKLGHFLRPITLEILNTSLPNWA